ncbi:MAG: TlpA family protein disulfide reductase, partial [Bdellovibrionales bacterium]|nr:TlpA family protein disulfide reductase [Bdellovibrionales bacterium]
MKIVILTAAMLLGGIAHGVTSSPRQIISQLGFSPLSTGPSDFELPQVGGGKRSLSSYQGQWIWITFWATWCAPCRHEMPTLEYLHQKFDGDQIAFLGVSIDQGATSGVEKFLQRHNITFPNLHDSQGEAASLYRATAVPTIYLISPDWKLVGL